MALEVPQKRQEHQQSHPRIGDDLGCGGGGTRNDHTPAITSTCVLSFDLSLSHHLQHHHQPSPITLDLFRCEVSSSTVELDEPSPLPFGWQKFLNIKTGEIYYTQNKQLVEEMSRNNGKSPKLDLKLNLSPPRANNQRHVVDSPNRSSASTPTSPPSSCVSSELNNNDDQVLRYSNSPEATSMVLVGCPRCLMYVMLSEEHPKCPKCKSSVLLDFLNENHTKKTSRKSN